MSITPWELPIVPKLKRRTIESLLQKNMRIDGRRLDQIRPVSVIPGYVERAEGSALAKIGETMVLAGVKMDVATPFPDMPGEGILIVHAEFVPLASPTFEPGPPDENAIELARVVDRSLREIKAVALDKLAIEPGKWVWRIYLDIYVLNHDGNLMDASMLAAMAALMSTRVPALVRREDGSYAVDRSRFTDLLPINHKVVTVNVAKIGDRLLLDPNFDEESVADVRLFIAVSDDGRIAGMQKAGMGMLSEQEIARAVKLALGASKVYMKALDEAVEPYRRRLVEELERGGGEARMEGAPAAPRREEPAAQEVVEAAGEGGGEEANP